MYETKERDPHLLIQNRTSLLDVAEVSLERSVESIRLNVPTIDLSGSYQPSVPTEKVGPQSAPTVPSSSEVSAHTAKMGEVAGQDAKDLAESAEVTANRFKNMTPDHPEYN